MPPRKVTKKEWDYEVRRAFRVRKDSHKKLKKRKYTLFDKVLSKYMPWPYIIGGCAMILMIVLYGWGEFFKFFLSWIVSITIIATIAFYMWKHYEKKLI